MKKTRRGLLRKPQKLQEKPCAFPSDLFRATLFVKATLWAAASVPIKAGEEDTLSSQTLIYFWQLEETLPLRERGSETEGAEASGAKQTLGQPEGGSSASHAQSVKTHSKKSDSIIWNNLQVAPLQLLQNHRHVFSGNGFLALIPAASQLIRHVLHLCTVSLYFVLLNEQLQHSSTVTVIHEILFLLLLNLPLAFPVTLWNTALSYQWRTPHIRSAK